MRFWKRMEIEWKILLLAAFILVGVVLPVQKFYSDKLKSTLDQSVDSGLEPLLREVLAIDSGILEDCDLGSAAVSGRIPIIVEGRTGDDVFPLSFLRRFISAFWSLKRLTRPLRTWQKC